MGTRKCLGCENNVPQQPGKRSKLFCSDKCRQKIWQEKRRKELNYLRAEKQSTVNTESKIIKEKKAPEPKEKDKKQTIVTSTADDELAKIMASINLPSNKK